MTYNVFGGKLNLDQSNPMHRFAFEPANRHNEKTSYRWSDTPSTAYVISVKHLPGGIFTIHTTSTTCGCPLWSIANIFIFYSPILVDIIN